MLAAACIALACVFAAFGADVLAGDHRAMDERLRRWTVERRSPVGVAIADFISSVGATEVLVVLASLVGWLALRRGFAWLAILVVSAAVSSQYVGLLKRSYDIVRPPTGVAERVSLGFPSGHSSGAAAICVFLGYVVVRKRRVSVSVATSAGVGTVLLVGLSRIYLDYHWLSDVLGGWMVGTAIGVGACAVWEWIQRHQRDDARNPTPPPGATPTRS